MTKKFDYIYINPHLHVLGRLSAVDYGSDEGTGISLGVGMTANGAYNIAKIHATQRFVPFDIKISESLNVIINGE